MSVLLYVSENVVVVVLEEFSAQIQGSDIPSSTDGDFHSQPL
jgi:hypothetical protein